MRRVVGVGKEVSHGFEIAFILFEKVVKYRRGAGLDARASFIALSLALCRSCNAWIGMLDDDATNYYLSRL